MDEETLTALAAEEAALAKEQASARYFYTTHTPHRYSSGPTSHYYADFGEGFREIRSLEEAREAALKARSGQWGHENLVETTYGMAYRTDNGNPYA